MVTHNPLHGSGQAALPHPALALGDDAKPHEWIGVTDAGEWQPARGVLREAAPWHSALLAAALEHPFPDLTDCIAEGGERRSIHGHSVVAEVTRDDRTQVGADLRDGVVQTSLQFDSHRLKLRLPPLAHRLPQHREPTLPGLPADMREAQKVEALRFPVAAVSPILVRVAAEFDEPCLVGMQPEAELRESFAEFREESLGLFTMLEPNDEVVGKAHDDHVPARLLLSPSLDPQVEYVVQVDVGQDRRNAAALDRADQTSIHTRNSRTRLRLGRPKEFKVRRLLGDLR